MSLIGVETVKFFDVKESLVSWQPFWLLAEGEVRWCENCVWS